MPSVRPWKPVEASRKSLSRSAFGILCFSLTLIEGCSIGPKYTKPVAQIPRSYKEMGNWKPAEPSDAVRKENWWEVFRDPELNSLEEKLTVSNQTLRAAQECRVWRRLPGTRVC